MTTNSSEEKVFYKPGSTNIEDVAICTNGKFRGKHSNRTAEEFKASGAELMSLNEARILVRASAVKIFCTGPVYVSYEDFNYALSVLPPERMSNEKGVFAFSCQEHTWCDLTDWYVKIGDLCVSFCESANIAMERVIAIAREFMATVPPPSPEPENDR